MRSFKELKVWEKSRTLVSTIYELSRGFPEDERFGITSQIRRAVVSISNNIAEGSVRESTAEFKHFLSIAHGSAVEVENMLILVLDIGIIGDEEFGIVSEQIIEVEKMLYGLKRSLK